MTAITTSYYAAIDLFNVLGVGRTEEEARANGLASPLMLFEPDVAADPETIAWGVQECTEELYEAARRGEVVKWAIRPTENGGIVVLVK